MARLPCAGHIRLAIPSSTGLADEEDEDDHPHPHFSAFSARSRAKSYTTGHLLALSQEVALLRRLWPGLRGVSHQRKLLRLRVPVALRRQPPVLPVGASQQVARRVHPVLALFRAHGVCL